MGMFYFSMEADKLLAGETEVIWIISAKLIYGTNNLPHKKYKPPNFVVFLMKPAKLNNDGNKRASTNVT